LPIHENWLLFGTVCYEAQSFVIFTLVCLKNFVKFTFFIFRLRLYPFPDAAAVDPVEDTNPELIIKENCLLSFLLN
jgi:hypothetical protein